LGPISQVKEKNQELSLRDMNRCDCVIEIWEENKDRVCGTLGNQVKKAHENKFNKQLCVFGLNR